MPTTVDGLDPADAHTWVEYSRCLQDLYARSGRPSFRKVASRSRRAGQAISPSTAQNLVAGARRPQRRSVEGFLAGCQLPKTERAAWLDVWDRLNARRGSEVSRPRATVPASIEDPAVRSRARLFYIGTVILLIGLIILAYLLGLEAADKLASVLSALLAVYTIAESRRTRRKDAASPNSAEQEEWSRAVPMRPTKAVVTATVTATVAFSCGNNVASAPDDRYSPYECSTPVGAAGSIAPRPTFAAGLVFCPLEVNDGIVDITGPFLVTGQILGTRPRGTELVLFVRIDPATCDTEGRPGAPGRFLLSAGQPQCGQRRMVLRRPLRRLSGGHHLRTRL